MADFNKLFNNFNKLIKKDKSAEELARERLQREMGNSGSILGIVFCGIALMWALLLILAGENTADQRSGPGSFLLCWLRPLYF